MPPPFKELTVRPSDGGQLITRASLDNAGLVNYSQKRDFRRDLDTEMRREGYDYFIPNTTKAIAGQPFPSLVAVSSITSSAGVATVTTVRKHYYENGEPVIISGATQTQYNGSFAISNVTDTTFQYAVAGSPASPATGTISAAISERLNLFHLARRPNGETAVIAGSQRRLYRYYSLEDPGYFEGDGTADEYFITDPLLGGPYFESNPGEWIVIGHGFSTLGKRWEAVSINGWSVFNNSVDLPVTYRVEETSVVPIYELREQGILSVGTIAEYYGILMIGDLTEIDAEDLEKLFELTGDIDGGNELAHQAVNTVTVLGGFFDATMIGKYIVYATGQSAQITAFGGDPRFATVGGPPLGITSGTRFKIRTKAAQAGSLFSGLITASQPSGTPNVTATGAIFNVGMVGKTLRYANGFSRTITAFTSTTQADLAGPNPAGSISFTPFWIIDPATSYTVVADSAIFTPEMVGLHILWDNGETRKILAYVNPTTVTVDLDLPVASDFIGIENVASYDRYDLIAERLTGISLHNRVQYRLAWSMIDLPRRFGAVIPGSISAGGFTLTLKFPSKSFEAGQSIRVVGAGVNGGDLVATILYVSALGKVLQLSELADTTVTDAEVQAEDAFGSIVGSQDLQDDTSAIIKMLDLQQTLVIHKDTSIFLAQYTGNVDAPFVFQRIKIPGSNSIYYRNTLVSVSSDYHLYAGRNSFFRFDLTRRFPVEIDLTDLMSDLFYVEATLDRTEEIWAADNHVTNEIWIVRPTGTQDKVICLDYAYQTISTSSMDATAAATVKRPLVGGIQGTSQDWFVMGTSQGVVLLYGRTDANQAIAGWPGNEIYFRRHANPHSPSKQHYDSILASGMAHFGDPFAEKDVSEYVLYLASQSPNTPTEWQLYGVRNVNEAPVLLATQTKSDLQKQNLIPMLFRANYFKEVLTVHGVDNPVRITARTWRVAIIGSRSAIRKA